MSDAAHRTTRLQQGLQQASGGEGQRRPRLKAGELDQLQQQLPASSPVLLQQQQGLLQGTADKGS
jgi:hypothetical protein